MSFLLEATRGSQTHNFLLAPLAKSAGGTEACKKVVFASKDDPDYLAILKTFDPITNLMKELPRIDFVGSKYVPHKHAHPVVENARPGEEL